MPKTAFITGITGQDGAYLSELLLSKNYKVHGLQRRCSLPNTERIAEQSKNGLILHAGDMTDGTNLIRLVNDIQPDEIYNLAAQSHVHVSFDVPENTGNIDGLGALRLLEAIRILGLTQKTKFFQASTSELYGLAKVSPQNEDSPFYPRSPYAVAKLYAYWMTINYREAYGIHACNGILFNHESPLRGEEFVTRKITMAVARISKGLQDCLYLGNLDAKRDWSHAKDMMDGVYKIIQHDVADNFVLASEKSYSVREFTSFAFAEAGITLEWRGAGKDEIGVDVQNGKTRVAIDKKYIRPTDVDNLLGDASKAKNILGWKVSMDLKGLIREMLQEDLKRI